MKGWMSEKVLDDIVGLAKNNALFFVHFNKNGWGHVNKYQHMYKMKAEEHYKALLNEVHPKLA